MIELGIKKIFDVVAGNFKDRIREKSTWIGVIGLIIYTIENIEKVKQAVTFFEMKPTVAIIWILFVVLVFYSEKGKVEK